MAKTPTTVRLNVAAALLLMEVQLTKSISRMTANDRDAIRDIQNARANLTNETTRMHNVVPEVLGNG